MSDDAKGGGLSLLDTALVAMAAVGVVLAGLWLFRVVLGVVLFTFKVVVAVIVVAVAVRVVHLFTRGRR